MIIISVVFDSMEGCYCKLQKKEGITNLKLMVDI